MKRRLGLFLLLAGTFVAASTLVSHALHGRSPAAAPLALHAVVVPVAQLGLLEAARFVRGRRKVAS